MGAQANQFSFFAQDEWKISNRLTLNYGMRYQVLPGFQEDGGNLANFDQNTNSIVVPDKLASYLQQQNLGASNLAFQQSFAPPATQIDNAGFGASFKISDLKPTVSLEFISRLR